MARTVWTSAWISDLGPGFSVLHHDLGEALGGRDAIFSLLLPSHPDAGAIPNP